MIFHLVYTIVLLLQYLSPAHTNPIYNARSLQPLQPASHDSGTGTKYDAVPASYVALSEGRGEINRVGNIDHVALKEYGLRDSESFYWGKDGNPLAKFTAVAADDNLKVLSMERFGDTLSTSRCSNNSVEFTLNDQIDFNQVHNAWSWINSDDANYVVLVTENRQCNVPGGDQTLRQPWHVSHATFNNAEGTVTLAAQPKSWEEAFNNWHFKVSSRGVLPRTSIRRRELHKRFNITKNASISLAHSFSGVQLPLIGGDISASIECNPCYTTGNLDYDISITADVFSGLTGTLSLFANDISGYFNMVSSASAPLTGDIGHTATLWRWSPPELGISIGMLGTLGFSLELDIDGGIGSTDAAFTLATGVNVSIPQGSVYEHNFRTGEEINQGWVPQFSLTPSSINSSVSLTAHAGPQLRLQFGGNILGGGADVGIMLAAPTLTVNATAIQQPNVCDVEGAAFGVELGVSLGGSVDTFEDLDLVVTTIGATQTILATDTTLGSTCFAVASVHPSVDDRIPSGSVSTFIPSVSVSSVSSHASAAMGSSPVESLPSTARPGLSSAAIASSTSSMASSRRAAGLVSSMVPASSFAAVPAPSSSELLYFAIDVDIDI